MREMVAAFNIFELYALTLTSGGIALAAVA
jgi:hypothetical protein